MPRRQQADGRRRRPAAPVPQGELQQRLRRHGGRHLPDGAAVPAVQPDAVPRRPSARCSTTRPRTAGNSPSRRTTWAPTPGERPGLRRRRADRREPDAGGGERQHAAAAGRAGARSRGTPTSPAATGRSPALGRVPRGKGSRPREPALHRRLRRPPGPQRRTSRSRPSRPSAAYGRLCEWPAARPRRGDYRKARAGPGREVGRVGRRRRPLPPRLRPARHVEPEVQPRLGPDPGPGFFPPETPERRSPST